jgi:prepilin-type N-terminal cleavage/methylation domain-containing protein
MIRSTRKRRAGYTLIELLVVIAIIALLVALSVGAVMRIITVQPRTQASYEIGKLQQSLQTAQQTYQGASLPGKLYLDNNIANYRTAAPGTLQFQTALVLGNMFGPRFIKNGATLSNGWDGTGTASGPFILEGDQALVFYLGGIPNTNGGANQCLGFSNNPLDPTATGGTRIGPFYQFPSSRLIKWPHPAGNKSGNFFSFLDPYLPSKAGNVNQPYAYFGANGPNNYNAAGDCPTLVILPYYQTAGVAPNTYAQYFNPNTFQIISAGADNNFGTGGGVWSSTSGTSDGPTKDNQTNFTKDTLVNPQG